LDEWFETPMGSRHPSIMEGEDVVSEVVESFMGLGRRVMVALEIVIQRR